MDILFFLGGLAAACLSAGLALYGLTHEFKDTNGRLTRAGRQAVWGTSLLALLSVGLFSWQWVLDRQASAETARKDRETLQLLQLAAIPTVASFSMIIEYADDDFLAQMHDQFWQTVDVCGDPPFMRDIDGASIFSGAIAQGGGIQKLEIPAVCGADQDSNLDWGFLNDWADYLGEPQIDIEVLGVDPADPEGLVKYDAFRFKPFDSTGYTMEFFYGFDYGTELSELHISRAFPGSAERGFATTASLIGGRFEMHLAPSFGAGEGATLASGMRRVKSFDLILTNGIVLRLGAGRIVENNAATVNLVFDMPKTTQQLIDLLRSPPA